MFIKFLEAIGCKMHFKSSFAINLDFWNDKINKLLFNENAFTNTRRRQINVI